tara:strand:+ start:3539 stop:3889 length:351 start_codon:yes stop_codon:yes gene_type:complete
LKSTDINKNFLQHISVASHACNFEICGAATKEKLYFFKNLSKNPKKTFFIDPEDYFKIYKKVIFFFHSHCLGGAKPSESDIFTSDEINRPFLIYSTVDKKFSFYTPKNKNLIYFSL